MQNRPEKSWYKSRTIWLGVLSAAAGVLMVVFPPGGVAGACVLAAVGVANIALRATDKGEP